jgi:hypothetical protein
MRASCHQPPYYTDNLMHDLKTERFFKPDMVTYAMQVGDGKINTFPLRGIKDNQPYLHDERLLTLDDTVQPSARRQTDRGGEAGFGGVPAHPLAAQTQRPNLSKIAEQQLVNLDLIFEVSQRVTPLRACGRKRAATHGDGSGGARKRSAFARSIASAQGVRHAGVRPGCLSSRCRGCKGPRSRRAARPRILPCYGALYRAHRRASGVHRQPSCRQSRRRQSDHPAGYAGIARSGLPRF